MQRQRRWVLFTSEGRGSLNQGAYVMTGPRDETVLGKRACERRVQEEV